MPTPSPVPVHDCEITVPLALVERHCPAAEPREEMVSEVDEAVPATVNVAFPVTARDGVSMPVVKVEVAKSRK